MITCHGKPVTLADLQRAYLRVCSRLHHPVQLRSKRRRATRLGNLREVARALGCNHNHLWRVVHGHRVSPVLLNRYAAWRREHGL